MKINNIIKGITVAALVLGMSSCEKFLDRPAEDNYNTANFYQTDEQCLQGVNYLYNSPWYDFQRGFIKIGEVMSGNMYWGSSPYMNFSTNGTDQDLVNMSYSLWAVNGHANTVISNLLASNGPSQTVKEQCIGECLTWKAMAYFFMVRTFGEVPIVHDNNDLLTSGQYNNIKKVTRDNVYEYIIMTLEKAMELLPKQTSNWTGRLDYYAAEGLLAKVYLTKAGSSGSVSSSDLAKAAEYAKDVIDNSGRSLTPTYSDVFRLSPSVYNATGENLISWLWTATGSQWTRQNTLQSDLAMVGFDEFGDCWGGYGGPSVDLMDAFGVDPTAHPNTRLAEKDSRRKATLMMVGDRYEYFWTDKGGFDVLRFIYDSEDYGKGGPGEYQSPTGANNVKHLYGNGYDHTQAVGHSADRMCNSLPTHLLRLSDIYLIYAEAVLNTNAAAALEYVNKVRERAGADALASVTWQDIWKERRLELAGEGDRWYDYVRRSYYDMDGVIAELKAQRRNAFWNLGTIYKKYYEDSSVWENEYDQETGLFTARYDEDTPAPNVTASSFTLPFPTEDLVFNPNLALPGEDVDVRATYTYNF